MPSAAGLAVQTLPTSVPAFWIWQPPICRAAARRPSNKGGRSASIRSVQVVRAGMRQTPPVRLMPRRPPVPRRPVMAERSRMSSSDSQVARAGKWSVPPASKVRG